jgi:threonine dehydrogenase-like Zn-dependent dehydrogenase
VKAVTWQGRRNVSVEDVADPVIKEPNDAIIKVTSTTSAVLIFICTRRWAPS